MKNTVSVKMGDHKETLRHLGGNKFLAMTDSKVQGYGHDNSGYVYLMFKLVKNKSKVTYLTVQYQQDDTYSMEFSRIKRTLNREAKALGIRMYDERVETVTKYEGVYADQLQEIFTQVTGMLTRL